jgi:predicted DsbA family dithiol-disulfide isomerase
MMMMFRSAALGAAIAAAACSMQAQPTRQPAPTDTVATVGSVSITLAEVDDVAMQRPAGSFGSVPLAQAVYEARRMALDALVAEHLYTLKATATGVTPGALTEREIMTKVEVPTEAEIQAWYTANPDRVQAAPLDQVRTPIKNLLIEERTRVARDRYLDVLKAEYPVAILLEPPRVEVAEEGHPARGPEDAPIHIVEFSDFECPYCLRAFPTVKQVLERYGDRVRFVYRHFPLPNHPHARPAAEAAACAHEQGKFWEYHDRLFASAGQLTPADLQAHAAAAGLDAARFGACVEARTYREQVDADIAAAQRAGVTGTPAFFVNGRPLSGAQPYENFVRLIEDELRRR